MEEFTRGKKVLVAGSTWPQDEEFLAQLIRLQPDWKFIIAPHEIREEKIAVLLTLLPEGVATRYSLLDSGSFKSSQFLAAQVLVIDNIGMLSSLYQYGQIGYIGGGFGVGIHNTLEAAAFGLPVLFGPNYERFKEARDLVASQLGFSIGNTEELQNVFMLLTQDDHALQAISQQVKDFVRYRTGATGLIMKYIG